MSETFPAAETASLTDRGTVRSSNQDACGVFSLGDGMRLLVVCDGLGGHRGGETASHVALEAIAATVSSGGAPSAALMRSAFDDANERILGSSARDPALRGMATTAVALLFDGARTAWVAHVGDSRAYRVRGGTIAQLTEDDSVVAERLRRGLITPEEAARLPRNELTRAIGMGVPLEVTVAQVEVVEGDRFVLCSDGLWNVVEDGEIAAAVMKDSPEEAVQGLVAVANQRGASDNVTVGVFSTGNGRVREVLLPASPEAIRAEAARVRSSRPIRVAGWAALAVALVLIGTLLWLRGVPQVKVAPAVSAPPPESSASMPSDPEKGSR